MKYRLTLLFTFLLILSYSKLYSQNANSFYFMKGVPQIYQVNPAFQPDCNFFIGLPGLAPLKVEVENSSFGINDVLEYNSDIDSLISFMHPLGSGPEAFLANLDETNYLGTGFSTSFASFGFRAGEGYFTFDIRERGDFNFDFSKDYVRFPLIGPDSGQVYDMSLGMDFTLLNEFSMGYSRKFGDKLTLGVRGKILFGQANINTENMDISLSTGEDSWTIQNDISVNVSGPYLQDYIVYAANAPFETVFGDVENFDPGTPDPGEAIEIALNYRNFGLALDIGADYQLYEWLQLSASIVDFGSVFWRDGMINLKHSQEFVYEGVEVSFSGDEDFGEDLQDSLENTYDNFTTTSTSYRTALPTKVFLGGAVYPHPKISFGLLSRTDFYKGDIRQQFTASANFYPISMLSASFSYSIINSSFKNIGFGLALRAFPLNLYLMTDTGPSVYFFPTDARYMNFKIGMNIMIGCKKAKKKFDRPLID